MIDEKKLLETLEGKAREADEYAERKDEDEGYYIGRASAFREAARVIEHYRAKLTAAHARNDARRSNATPICQDFVFPLTMEEEQRWNEQAELLRKIQDGETEGIPVTITWEQQTPKPESPFENRKPVRCCDDDCGEQRTLRFNEQNPALEKFIDSAIKTGQHTEIKPGRPDAIED